MKCKIKCVKCDCFLREKVRRDNDFENRMLCYKCYKDTGWSYRDLKRIYPEKVNQFFEKKEPKQYVNFGKYKGKTFDCVYNCDEKYCKWIYDKSKETQFSQNSFIKYLTNIYT